MNVAVETKHVGKLVYRRYTFRSFTVHELNGDAIPCRVWWQTTNDRQAFLSVIVSDGEAAIDAEDGADEQRLSDASIGEHRISVTVEEGRVVWLNQADDRWATHERPPYGIMVVGNISPPLVELRPRGMSEQTAKILKNAVTSKREE